MPVDPTRVDEFDPARVPTVGQLLKEIDEAMLINSEDGPEGTQQFPGKSFVHRSGEGMTMVCSIITPTPTNSVRRDVVEPHFLT